MFKKFKKHPVAEANQMFSRQEQINTKGEESQLRLSILEALSTGRKTKQDLVLKCHVTDREIRATVRELRRDGYPICSSNSTSGYWLGSTEEVRRTISDYYSRATDLFKTAQALEHSLNECLIKDSPFNEVCNGCVDRERCFQ